MKTTTLIRNDGLSKFTHWLHRDAVPLWRTNGIDKNTGTVWEALDHQGQPCFHMNRRLRVQVRQAYCFAVSAGFDTSDPELGLLALRLFRFSMDNGFDAKTGNLASWLAPDTAILTAPHDLYDLTFMLLAAAALVDAGFNIEQDLERLEDELAKLKAPQGWYENTAQSLPRRQNPHMHLFEASTALFRATGKKQYLHIAQECLALFFDVFLRDDMVLLEFFSPDWQPLSGDAQSMEPGHMAEWVYLIDRFEDATGIQTNAPLEALFQKALGCREASGFLPDRCEVQPHTCRLWPQTELLKATLVMQRRGVKLVDALAPETVLENIWQTYLETPVPGGWYDKYASTGALLSKDMPASSFYHIVVAWQFYTA